VPPEEPTLVWMRAAGPAPEDPLVHAALFTYASDMRILHPALRPHGRSMYGDDVRPATIDHTVWFHRPTRVDEWLLWRCDSPWAGDGRGFVRASLYDGSGTLVASAAQEGLIRFT
jgi:acyl-CoA thioesterase-2